MLRGSKLAPVRARKMLDSTQFEHVFSATLRLRLLQTASPTPCARRTLDGTFPGGACQRLVLKWHNGIRGGRLTAGLDVPGMA